MFNKTTLALAFSTLVGAPSVYAIVSGGSPPVVGFKPVLTNKTGKGAVSGDLLIGSRVSVNTQDIAKTLGFDDKDGDKPDEANFKYSWTVDGNVLSTTPTVALPNDIALRYKPLVLTITPVSISGEPLTGDPLVLDNLNEAGAHGGDGKGNISVFNHTLTPYVSEIRLAGALEVGKDLTASYKFKLRHSQVVADGVATLSDTVLHLVEDHSIFVWGRKSVTGWDSTKDTATRLARLGVDRSDPNVIQVSGQVPAYTIRKDDVGEVLELTIFPRTQNRSYHDKMFLVMHNNQEWYFEGNISSQPKTVTTDGGSAGGLIDPNKDGKVSWAPVEPRDVKINFTSSATVAVNGVDGVRPVAAKDELKATFTPAANASPYASDYTFQWKAAGNNIGTAEVGKDTFTPGPQYQGKPISVDVLPAKKAVP
ncbi:hypothetical protein ACEUD2_03160 [Aeromonas veronii]|uniref:hypothetical protein n=1 Tax=Aeromonas veronii TaxID=654 RepID=UPI00191CE4AF|nr:hypothetical protein [Aeromonas veronii]MBL0495300.1 hypothetical protein [Aeromonas veronii]